MLQLKRDHHPDSGIHVEQAYPQFDYLITLVDLDIVSEYEILVVWGDEYDYLPGKDQEKGYAIAVPLALNCQSLDEYTDLLWGNPSADPYPEEIYFDKTFHPWLERIAASHNWEPEVIYRWH